MRTGAGPGQPDDDEGSITSGSPKNLLLVAIAVALLTSAGLVFFIAWQWEDLGSASGKWRVACSILSFHRDRRLLFWDSGRIGHYCDSAAK
jgi:hypothetical protein